MSLANNRRAGTENVRMGPIALFTLVTVLCLAVLAILATTTANATVTLSQRRADATDQLYLQETAAQTFLATLDARLAEGTADASALEDARAAALATVPAASETELSVEASGDYPSYTARFACGSGRTLAIALSYGTDGVLTIDEWRMTSVVHDEPSIGTLLGGS